MVGQIQMFNRTVTQAIKHCWLDQSEYVDKLDLLQIQRTNTNNLILHRIKNNKTLATSYFSMGNLEI